MKQILLLVFCLLFFGCESSNRNSKNTDAHTTPSDNNASESVQQGAGSEISPQLEGIEDSAARLEVDSVSTSAETNPAK